MGKRGPPPKPTARKKFEGTFRKDRAARNEIEAPLGAPAMPSWLDAEGKAEWKRIVPVLLDLGVLSTVDQGMLADYCAAHSLCVKATKQYQREGLVVKSFGQAMPHPMIKIAKEARAQAQVLAREFGLSPSARSRVGAPEKKKPPAPGADATPLVGPGLRVVPGGASRDG